MEHLLEDATPEHEFILGQRRIKNLHELVSVLKEISDIEFSYYSNDSKNDFSSWIRDIIKDETLAEDLLDCHKREETINCIESRIEWIKYEVENMVPEITEDSIEKIDFKIKKEDKTQDEIPETNLFSEIPKESEFSGIFGKDENKKTETVKSPKSYMSSTIKGFLIGLLIGLFIGIMIGRSLSFIKP